LSIKKAQLNRAPTRFGDIKVNELVGVLLLQINVPQQIELARRIQQSTAPSVVSSKEFFETQEGIASRQWSPSHFGSQSSWTEING